MEKIDSVAKMRLYAAAARAAGKTIALVPTMGALHAGQEALVRAAVQRANVVIVSIFVNPLAFGPNEFMANYPRSFDEDVKKCEACGAQAVFAPSIEEMVPKGHSSQVIEEAVSKVLCGPSRPAHFRGVTTMMAKLLNVVQPHQVYFGQKTAQRAAVVRKMAADLLYDVEVIVMPTVREPDGLAYGVRNRDLTPGLRQDALALHKALKRVQEMVATGVRSPDRLIAEATHVLSQQRRVRIIYISIVDPRTMESMRDVIPGTSLMTIAVWIDEIRFIDNAVL
jgi:pantoate--beta-alanine ligase